MVSLKGHNNYTPFGVKVTTVFNSVVVCREGLVVRVVSGVGSGGHVVHFNVH